MTVEIEQRIVIEPEKCNGKPIIRGQQITVQTVLAFLSAGDSVKAVLQAYPTLEKEDIYVCLAYASRVSLPNYVSTLYFSSPSNASS